MSIDLNWETVTGGPDGQELANKIRDFIHTKFQAIPLPRFIKSVTVHDFQFGTIPPEIELKDITDPLPDFYEDNVDSDLASEDSEPEEDVGPPSAHTNHFADERRRRVGGAGILNRAGNPPPYSYGLHGGLPGSRNGELGSPFLRVSTPGIPGGTSNLHYFHPQFTGLSGTQTPLAAVAGAHHLGTWLEGHGHSASSPNIHQHYGSHFIQSPQEPVHYRNHSQSSISVGGDISPAVAVRPPSPSPAGRSGTSPPPSAGHSLKEKHSVSTLAPTSAGASATGNTGPPTRDAATALMGSAISDEEEPPNYSSQPTTAKPSSQPQPQTSPQQAKQQQQPQPQTPPPKPRSQPRFRERRVDDLQAVFRIRYAGDVKLLLTADILLDYPMPSFVGIPVRLSITGLTFDGVGVLAKIRRRVHFCFLSPEDAVIAVGANGGGGNSSSGSEEEVSGGPQVRRRSVPNSPPPMGTGGTKLGGLLQEIRVESEIGERVSGKQSLRNVGKVERFVLEQVRRIFEEELVYPSFWTFLV